VFQCHKKTRHHVTCKSKLGATNTPVRPCFESFSERGPLRPLRRRLPGLVDKIIPRASHQSLVHRSRRQLKVSRFVPDLTGSVPPGAHAEAWCLFIHADASLSSTGARAKSWCLHTHVEASASVSLSLLLSLSPLKVCLSLQGAAVEVEQARERV